MTEPTEFFRVVPDSDDTCPTCKKGSLVTVAYTDETGEEVGVGISWDADGDGPDSAEAHAHELNWAFGLGVKHADANVVAALRKVYEALMSDPPHGPQKHIGPDCVIYQLDGQLMFHAINAARDALAIVNASTHAPQKHNGG